MLEIENLHVEVHGKPILNGLTLSVPTGQVHAIMGPNGSGKSTLSYAIAGRDGYVVTSGDVRVNGQSILSVKGFNNNYALRDVTEALGKALRKGENTLAVHTHQTTGGQFIDLAVLVE